MKTTPNKLIHIGSPIPFDTEKFFGDWRIWRRLVMGIERILGNW